MQSRRSLLTILTGLMPAVLLPASASAAVAAPQLADQNPDVLAELKKLRARVEELERRTSLPNLDGVPLDELHERAIALGVVLPGQFNGLGFRTLEPGESGELQDTMNRNCFLRRLTIEAGGISGNERVPAEVGVEQITFAGLPVNIGYQSMPLTEFSGEGIDLGRRLALVGQTARVVLRNVGPHRVIVHAGYLCDEVNPYIAQRLYERILLQHAQAAADGHPVDPEAYFTSDGEGLLRAMIEVA